MVVEEEGGMRRRRRGEGWRGRGRGGEGCVDAERQREEDWVLRGNRRSAMHEWMSRGKAALPAALSTLHRCELLPPAPRTL